VNPTLLAIPRLKRSVKKQSLTGLMKFGRRGAAFDRAQEVGDERRGEQTFERAQEVGDERRGEQTFERAQVVGDERRRAQTFERAQDVGEKGSKAWINAQSFSKSPKSR
jgi:hypothetical protein